MSSCGKEASIPFNSLIVSKLLCNWKGLAIALAAEGKSPWTAELDREGTGNEGSPRRACFTASGKELLLKKELVGGPQGSSRRLVGDQILKKDMHSFTKKAFHSSIHPFS